MTDPDVEDRAERAGPGHAGAGEGGHLIGSAFATILDQGFSTASNAVLVIAVASNETARTFGDFALAYGFFAFALGMQRASVGDPFLVNDRESGMATAADEARFLRNSVLTAAGGALLLASAGLLASADLARFLLLFSGCALVVLLQDGLRYLAISRGHPERAAAMDGLWLTAMLGGTLILSDVDGEAAIAIWAIGAVISLGAGVALLRPPGIGTIRRTAPPGQWIRMSFGLEFTAVTVGGLALLGGVRVLIGPQATAAIAAVVAIYQPAHALLAGLRLYYLPRLRNKRATPAYRPEIALWTSVVIGVLASWITLSLVAGGVFSVLLGDTWSVARPILVAGGAFQLFVGIGALRSDHLKVVGAGHLLVMGRVLFTVAFVGGALIGASASGLDASATGLAMGAGLGLLGWLVMNDPSRRSANPTAAGP